MLNLPKKLVVFILKGYKLILSPFLGQNCRFHPGCANYTIEAVQVHGAVKGLYLGARRIARCHPFNPGGYDPVPPKSQNREQTVVSSNEIRGQENGCQCG